ncbi:MAG: DUF362 domain-containing protein [Nitrososphaera sp.]|nr:DUF362 domain-containing protein [Nitrososphaera sp.]
MSRVFIERFNQPERLRDIIKDALDWTHARAIIAPGARVFIKPNLTWKQPAPGVTVTPAFLRALVETLLPITSNIIIGESEGGQACFQAEEAFQNHGLYDLKKKYGIQVVNLSKGQHEITSALVGGKPISVQLPSLLLHEVDVFMTVPVPKIHALTGVSIGFKNQWGCLGDKMRVNQHPRFGPVILAINKLLKPRLCICDGTYFLDYTGPMMGEAIPMNLVIAGDDIGAASLACCKIMKIDPMSISHYRLARKEGMFPESLDRIVFNRPPQEFAQRQFRLRRAFINYIHLAAFKSVILNRIFYDSIFADALHEILWFIRRNSLIKRFLYGKYGTGEANRGGRVV